MIVVDTDVVAYFFIEGDKTERARALWEQDDWRLPELWRHEFLNVLASYVRAGGMEPLDAMQLWENADALLAPVTHAVDMRAALTFATRHDISAYDAQFITLASTLACSLVTDDRELQKKFPDVTVSL